MNLYIFTGCKKFRIQTLRVCRGDKMKPFCYVTTLRGSPFPRQRSLKGLTQDGFTEVVENVKKITLSLFVTYYRKCWRMSRYKSGNDYGSSMTGPQHTFPLMSENT